METPSYIFLSFRVRFFFSLLSFWCKNIHARNTKWKGTCTSVIYLKFVAVVLANAYICVYARSRGRNSYKVIISLWWMSRDRFFNEFTLTATQVHIKARSSCITAGRLSKRNVFFLPFSLLYIVFHLCSAFSRYSFSLRVFFRARFRVIRACIQCLERMEMYVQKPHIKNTILHMTTSYDTR